MVSISSKRHILGFAPHLKLNLCLCNVLLATIAVGDLLCFGNLSSDRLGAEVLQGVTLDGVDAQDGVGLDSSEAARD